MISLKLMKAACMGDVSVFAHTPQLEHLFINKAAITGNYQPMTLGSSRAIRLNRLVK